MPILDRETYSPARYEIMIPTVSPSRPVDLLRASSDQIRRAAEILAQIADETGPDLETRLARAPVVPTVNPDEMMAARQATIQQAQRSFVAGLRLTQIHDDPTP